MALHQAQLSRDGGALSKLPWMAKMSERNWENDKVQRIQDSM